MPAFVTHTTWPCMSALALLPVTVILALRLKGQPPSGPMQVSWKTEERVRKETAGKKTRPQCGGEIILSWEERPHREESKSMKNKSS